MGQPAGRGHAPFIHLLTRTSRKADTRMNNRQTASFLMRRFQNAGIRPDSRRGQNFLVDLNLLQVLVDAFRRLAPMKLQEVGTGPGVTDRHPGPPRRGRSHRRGRQPVAATGSSI